MTLRLTLSTVLISSLVSPLLAQQPAPVQQPIPSPSAAAQIKPAKPAKQEPSPPDSRRYATGTLKALDAEAETVTFTDASGKDVTWAVDARIAQNARAAAERRMAILKPGAAVRIVYHLDANGVPKVIDIGRHQERRQGEGDAGAATAPAPPAPPQ